MMNKSYKEVDLSRDATYIVSDGRLQEVESPSSGYGKQVIRWEAGNPYYCEVSCSSLINKN